MSYQTDKPNGKNDYLRIIKRNLVYVIGLDPKIANKDILMKREFLGQYGKITRLIVNFNKAYTSNNTIGPSYSAYINYNTEEEAALAILSIDSSSYNGKQIKAAFGTTKYCAYYLKKIACPNRECVYIHTQQDKSNMISKESSDFYIEQHKIAIKVSDIANPKVKDALFKNRHEETQFPNPYTLYFKKNIISQLKIDIEKDLPQQNLNSNYRQDNSYNNRNYNQPLSKKQIKGLNNYFDTNNDNYYATKTVIKEINYDEDKSLRTSNNFNISKERMEIKSNNSNSIDKEQLINNSTNYSDSKENSHSRSCSSQKASIHSIISTRDNSRGVLDDKINNNYKLFKIETKSKFDFANAAKENTTETFEDEIEHQSKFLQQYYMRYSFASLAHSNTIIEEDFFSKLQLNLC